MTITILHGNCMDTLATLADESVHACVTSPPYWSLRDYQTAAQPWPAVTYAPMPGLPPCVHVPAMTCSLGLEPTLEAFIGHIVLVFREVRRVLRADGTLWVNMGDSYVGNRGAEAWGPSAKARQGRAIASRRRDNAPVPRSDVRVPGLKAKDMVGQPWRVAFALQADGWWLRSEVIWDKPNPMPESTKDRPTKAHEQLFLLSKSERYWYDHDAIKEPASGNAHPRKAISGWAAGEGTHSAIAHARPGNNGVGWGHGTAPKPRTVGRKAGGAYVDGKSERLGRGPGWRVKDNPSMDAALANVVTHRAKRSVWRIPTEAVKEAHFATFPTKLVEPCILASCPPGGVVLDPFGGSGTVGLVADRHQRHGLLCELSATYIAIARRRLTRESPLLTHLEVFT